MYAPQAEGCGGDGDVDGIVAIEGRPAGKTGANGAASLPSNRCHRLKKIGQDSHLPIMSLDIPDLMEPSPPPPAALARGAHHSRPAVAAKIAHQTAPTIIMAMISAIMDCMVRSDPANDVDHCFQNLPDRKEEDAQNKKDYGK